MTVIFRKHETPVKISQHNRVTWKTVTRTMLTSLHFFIEDIER